MFRLFHNNGQSIGVDSSASKYFGAQTAIVTKAIHAPRKKGRVRCYGGILWSAICHGHLSLEPGQKVRIISRQGNTLLVEPMMSLSRDSASKELNSAQKTILEKQSYSMSRKR